MSHLYACRICLRTDGKMYDYNCFKLKLFYEELMAIEVDNSDYLPHYFCIECATMLHKFHKFKEKCNTGQNTLEALMWGNTLHLKSIEDIDRKSKNLLSPLGRISATAKIFNYTYDTNSFTSHESVHVKVELIEANSFQVDNTDVYINDDVNHSESEIFVEEPNIIKIEPNLDDTIAVNTNAIDNNDDSKMMQQNNDDLTMENDDSHLDTEITTNSSNIKRKKVTPKQKLTKRIRTSTKKTETKEVKHSKDEFDPSFWLTVTFSEKEALEEFAARAQDSRYFTAKYKCNKCMKGFSRKDMLKRHDNLRHNENNPFVCGFCKMTFERNCYLSRHMPEHYKKYKCLRCNIVFNGIARIALRHGDLHSGVIRKCEYCGKEFRHLNTYNSHIRLIHRSEHVCTLCGASFKNNYGLLYHRKIAHSFEETEAVEGLGEYCSRCDIRFETRAAYDEHFAHSAKHDDNKKSEENSSLLLKTKKLTILNPSRRDFTKSFDVDCHICGKHFHSRSSYVKHHQAEHPGTALFAPHQCLVCEICGKSVYPNKMKRHIMAHGDSPYGPVTCPVCHKKYSNTYNMRNHYRTQHETDPAKKIEKSKNFTCDVCGVVMSQKNNLVRHMRIHTGELPYECELCGRRFRQSSSKKLHFRTVHLKEPHPKKKPRPKGVAKKKTVHQGGNEDDSKGNIHLYLQ